MIRGRRTLVVLAWALVGLSAVVGTRGSCTSAWADEIPLVMLALAVVFGAAALVAAGLHLRTRSERERRAAVFDAAGAVLALPAAYAALAVIVGSCLR